MIEDTDNSTDDTTIPVPIAMVESAFMAIAFYNVIELHFLLFTTFKRWRSLYFWSVFAAMWGVALNGLGVVFKTFKVIDDSPPQLLTIVTVLLVGWYLMVTGQSVALYSRLHLVVHNTKIVRGVLLMIIFLAITCHIPLTVVIYVMNTINPPTALKVYKVYEPLQLTLFSVQEATISILYMVFAVKILRPSQAMRGSKTRKTLWQLICINVLVIVLDITLIALQFAGYDEVQHFYKPAVYSIKLKLEFAVLNQLLEVTQGSKPDWIDYRFPTGTGTTNVGSLSKHGSRGDGEPNLGDVEAGRHVALAYLHKDDNQKRPRVLTREGWSKTQTQQVGVNESLGSARGDVAPVNSRVRASPSPSQVHLVEAGY
ncbi:hypothetical protein VFPPC_08577 [Pochonia chlamydosporia 170]|uniref:DUF7703 domain-containing protein n=1 Tax=Pochonia chlamydosporia 170 TaxID=1380566 RepID=A0A179FPG9_METCM|nr:hypothetical protein VFPPC_08577 [Pochonia chlamydosporia 170]OAQ67130.2 hypothetical protein VFPPC_08577 [Pochonia chlamydosporia 170]